MPTDDELVAAKLAGDPEAFATLVGRYGGMVRAVALRTLGSGHANVDDAVQAAWLRAYRYLPRYDGRGRFGGWLPTTSAGATASPGRCPTCCPSGPTRAPARTPRRCDAN
jgi:hypothetical protein